MVEIMPGLQFRNAQSNDLVTLVEMLANDALGSQRERFELPLPQNYLDAFDAIDQDPNNELVVAALDSQIVGLLQLTFIPSLTYRGGWRAQIEGVRIAPEHRGKGFGRKLLEWSIKRAKERRCHLVQLTTDKARPNALRFYQDLGFEATHEGMKLHLDRAKPDGQ